MNDLASAADKIEKLEQVASAIRKELHQVIKGQDDLIEKLLISLFAGGHALIVGVPGLAKTLAVSSLAQCLGLSFGRVQFTPDLLPADITGTEVMTEVEQEGRRAYLREFSRGPIFENIVLADEVNRTPPKTQAALLQAMQEREVSIGGTTHELPKPFLVLATRNPIEQEGTYPLPEAQLDRFLLEIEVDYPSFDDELWIAEQTTKKNEVELKPLVSSELVEELQAFVKNLPVTDDALRWAVNVVRATRPLSESQATSLIRFGAGPRGTQAVILAAKASAALRGQAAVDVADVKRVALAALRHRVVLNYRAEAEGVQIATILEEIFSSFS